MLKMNHITKVFSKDTINEKIALNELDLVVNDGDFITIIGTNGAGKSTLFHLIAGDYICESGSIYLDDENITFMEEHKRSKMIGRLFQDPLKGTAPHMSIAENLALAYLRANTFTNPFSRITRNDRIAFKKALSQLDMNLEERMDTKVGTLSGGQRQALTLLMATIVPPRILLLDEHTAALDPSAQVKIMELTNKIVKKHNTTCLMITHNMKDALAYGNRTLVMNGGKIVMDLNEEEKKKMTVEKLLEQFKVLSEEGFDNDRVLLSSVQ